MFRSAILPAAFALLAVQAPAAAGEAPERQAVRSLEAYAAYKSGDYAAAYALWLPLAEQGNATAMLNLANMHEQGQGRAVDLAQAARWLRRAADAGDPRGQYYLGLAYEKGRGVARDNREAARWFRAAAEQGEAEAQFSLGVMLATNYGQGVAGASADQRAEARHWLSKAAAQGHAEAAILRDAMP